MLLDFGVPGVRTIFWIQTYRTWFIDSLLLNELLHLSCKCVVVWDDAASIRVYNCNMALTLNFARADQSFVQDLRWVSTSLLHSRASQDSIVHVFSDSVLCLEKMGDNPVESWKEQIQWYSDNNYFSELNRIGGRPVEFEWKIFPGFTTMAILNEIQEMMGQLQREQENFTGRIIFMSMFKDIVWDAKGNDELCVHTSKTRFPRGHWSFLGPGSEKEVVRNLRMQTRWILESNCGENCCRISQDPVIRYSVVPVPWK